MKKLIFLFVFCTIFLGTYAQGTKYIIHTVTKGETLTRLAQEYHTTVGDIMHLNKMNAKSQLKIGEKIKIPGTNTAQKNTVAKATTTKAPATKTTPSKTTRKPLGDSAVITHYVLKGETLSGISKKFGVTVEQLKEWNSLSDDNIHFGQLLAVNEAGVRIVAAKYGYQSKVEEQKAEVATTEDENISNSQKKEITDSVSITQNSNNEMREKQDTVNEVSGIIADSYFAKDFSVEKNNPKDISGDAMTFKTASGWNDKKYYILMSGIPSGKIVKVSANGKSIYAKVLWSLDNSQINDGLSFRISDAAASALGENESKFNLTVAYNE